LPNAEDNDDMYYDHDACRRNAGERRIVYTTFTGIPSLLYYVKAGRNSQ